MRILIAEDDLVSRTLLEAILKRAGHEVVVCTDGNEVKRELADDNVPRLAVLDWMMPGADGPDLCRQIRSDERLKNMYVILLTAKGSREDVLEGLTAGADDYVTKPFDRGELLARITPGARVVEAERALAARVRELEEAQAHIRTLSGLLPMCAWCHNVREDDGYWKKIELYVSENTDATFTHGLCPECAVKLEAQLEEKSKS